MITEPEKTNFLDAFDLIQKTVGWTDERFGKEIGVKKQTINAIEKRTNSLTTTTYMAMRFALNEEINANPHDTKLLQSVLSVFVDDRDKFSDTERHNLRKVIDEKFAKKTLKKVEDRKKASDKWMKAITITLTSAAAGLIVAGIVGILKKH